VLIQLTLLVIWVVATFAVAGLVILS